MSASEAKLSGGERDHESCPTCSRPTGPDAQAANSLAHPPLVSQGSQRHALCLLCASHHYFYRRWACPRSSTPSAHVSKRSVKWRLDGQASPKKEGGVSQTLRRHGNCQDGKSLSLLAQSSVIHKMSAISHFPSMPSSLAVLYTILHSNRHILSGAMDNGKDTAATAQFELGSNEEPDLQQVDEGRRYDAAYDKRDMRRLGRKQELKRRFRYFSLIGYMLILASCWENVLLASVFAIPNGGTAGYIWMTLLACLGQSTAMLSMAEMGSISPTAGGQYVRLMSPRHAAFER